MEKIISISFFYLFLVGQVFGSTNGLLYVCDPTELTVNNVCVFVSSVPEDNPNFTPVEHNIDRDVGGDFYRQVVDFQGNKLSVTPIPWTNGDTLAEASTKVTGVNEWGYVLAFEMVAPLRDMMMYHPTKLTTDEAMWQKWTRAFTDCEVKIESEGGALNTDDVYAKMKDPAEADIHHFVLQYLEESAIDLVCMMTDLDMDRCDVMRAKWNDETYCDCFAAAYEDLYDTAPPTLTDQFTTCTLSEIDEDNTSEDSTTEESCADGCDTSMVGDGFCDSNCMVPACDMDGGDCSNLPGSDSMEECYTDDACCDYMDCCDYTHCQDTECVCTKEYNPQCGSDGKTYDNPCTAECYVDEYEAGECASECMCTKEYNPQCGSDGKTYDNPCTAECYVDEYEAGECSSECMCTKEYNPQCGSDGKTYDNPCTAECYVDKYEAGECVEDVECTCSSWQSGSVAGDTMCQFGDNCSAGTNFPNGCPDNALTCTLGQDDDSGDNGKITGFETAIMSVSDDVQTCLDVPYWTIYYPVGPKDQKYPVLSFAHGFQADPTAQYTQMLQDIAMEGYVIVAGMGCKDVWDNDWNNYPWTPNWSKTQMQMFDEVKLIEEYNSMIDWTAPTGIFGHSMGGAATAYNGWDGETMAQYNVGASVLLNAYTPPDDGIVFEVPQVPTLHVAGETDALSLWQWNYDAFLMASGDNAYVAGKLKDHNECVGFAETCPNNEEYYVYESCVYYDYIVSMFDCYLKDSSKDCENVYEKMCDESMSDQWSGCATTEGIDYANPTDLDTVDVNEIYVGDCDGWGPPFEEENSSMVYDMCLDAEIGYFMDFIEDGDFKVGEIHSFTDGCGFMEGPLIVGEDLYACSLSQARIVKWHSEYLVDWGQAASPAGMDYDKNTDTILVADMFMGGIVRFSTEGEFLELVVDAVAHNMCFLNDVAWVDDIIFFTDTCFNGMEEGQNHATYCLRPDGVLTMIAGGPDCKNDICGANGVAASNDGTYILLGSWMTTPTATMETAMTDIDPSKAGFLKFMIEDGSTEWLWQPSPEHYGGADGLCQGMDGDWFTVLNNKLLRISEMGDMKGSLTFTNSGPTNIDCGDGFFLVTTGDFANGMGEMLVMTLEDGDDDQDGTPWPYYYDIYSDADCQNKINDAPIPNKDAILGGCGPNGIGDPVIFECAGGVSDNAMSIKETAYADDQCKQELSSFVFTRNECFPLEEGTVEGVLGFIVNWNGETPCGEDIEPEDPYHNCGIKVTENVECVGATNGASETTSYEECHEMAMAGGYMMYSYNSDKGKCWGVTDETNAMCVETQVDEDERWNFYEFWCSEGYVEEELCLGEKVKAGNTMAGVTFEETLKKRTCDKDACPKITGYGSLEACTEAAQEAGLDFFGYRKNGDQCRLCLDSTDKGYTECIVNHAKDNKAKVYVVDCNDVSFVDPMYTCDMNDYSDMLGSTAEMAMKCGETAVGDAQAGEMTVAECNNMAYIAGYDFFSYREDTMQCWIPDSASENVSCRNTNSVAANNWDVYAICGALDESISDEEMACIGMEGCDGEECFVAFKSTAVSWKCDGINQDHKGVDFAFCVEDTMSKGLTFMNFRATNGACGSIDVCTPVPTGTEWEIFINCAMVSSNN